MKTLKLILPLFLLGFMVSCDTPEQANKYNDKMLAVCERASTLLTESDAKMEAMEDFSEETISDFTSFISDQKEKLATIKTEMEGMDDYHGDATLKNAGLKYLERVSQLLEMNNTILTSSLAMIEDGDDASYDEYSELLTSYDELLETSYTEFSTEQEKFAAAHDTFVEK